MSKTAYVAPHRPPLPAGTTGATPVAVGDTIEYTLTFTNVGESPAFVAYLDSLRGVLDDVTVATLPTVTPIDGGLTYWVNPVLPSLAIVGSVDPGETVTLTYSVLVGDTDGDGLIVNTLTPADDPIPGHTSCDGLAADACTMHEIVNPAICEVPAGPGTGAYFTTVENGTSFTLASPDPAAREWFEASIAAGATITIDSELVVRVNGTFSEMNDGVPGEVVENRSYTTRYVSESTAPVSVDGGGTVHIPVTSEYDNSPYYAANGESNNLPWYAWYYPYRNANYPWPEFGADYTLETLENVVTISVSYPDDSPCVSGDYTGTLEIIYPA